MSSGYLYVLVHPSNPNLYKIGVTILAPKERLAQHNRSFEKAAGKVVKETGQNWELKTYIPVPDPYEAERVFWRATPLADIPFLGNVEVQNMEWPWVEQGLAAARKAGVRPAPERLPDWVYGYTEWMQRRLTNRGISLIGMVKSKTGKANFQCVAGHTWRTRPDFVAGGAGCPMCGIGQRDPEEIERVAGGGYLCLLVHPAKPGVIRIELTSEPNSAWTQLDGWRDWDVHRHRHVDDMELAESIIWGLLGTTRPDVPGPIAVELKVAEQAMRALVYEMSSEIALRYRAKIESKPRPD